MLEPGCTYPALINGEFDAKFLRNPALLLCAIALVPSNGEAQWTSIQFGPLGVAFPSGFDFESVDTGGAGELFARYHFDGALSLGGGVRVSIHDLEDDFTMTLTGILLEARYGRQLNGQRLSNGERFFPYVGVRIGRGAATVAFPESDREATTRGWEVGPVAGLQYWLFRNFGFDLAASAPFDRLKSTNGRSVVFQPSIVVGW